MITVVRDPYVPSWPKRARCIREERGFTMRAGDAFERAFTTDAHFTQYRSAMNRRLSLDALDRGVSFELTHVVFDVDPPGHVATPEWRLSTREKVVALNERHPGVFYYETRNGARIVYRQTVATVVASRDDAREWKRTYAIGLAYLARRFQIAADPSCADVTRLFRLPRATREIGGKPENHPSWGDAHAIGSLEISADASDVSAAKATSKAWQSHRVIDHAPCAASGDGILFAALQARGDIIRAHGAGAYVVRCPNEAQHSSGRTGDGSTILYLPAAGECVGAVCCLHAHCSDLTVRDWLRLFSDSERDAARERAGVSDRRRAA